MRSKKRIHILLLVKRQWMDIGLPGKMVHARPTLRCQRGTPAEKVGRCRRERARGESLEGNIAAEETPTTGNAQQKSVQVYLVIITFEVLQL